jgi:hypothetical protein
VCVGWCRIGLVRLVIRSLQPGRHANRREVVAYAGKAHGSV